MIIGAIIIIILLALACAINFYLWLGIRYLSIKIGIPEFYKFFINFRNTCIQKVQKNYAKFMEKILNNIWKSTIICITAILIFIASIGLVISKQVPFENFPDKNVTNFTIKIELPSGIVLSETRKLMEPVAGVLREYFKPLKNGDVMLKNFVCQVGSSTKENILTVDVNLTDTTDRKTTSYQLIPVVQKKIKSVIPNYAKLEVGQEQSGPPGPDAAIEIRLYGTDFVHLKKMAEIQV